TQPPAAPAAAPAPADTTKHDSTAMDSTMHMMDSTMAMDSTMGHMMAAAPAPAPVAAPTEWPVDPATGQTLINGEPVVGKVFIMQKTDGTKKIENVAMALQGEPPAAAPATVGSTKAPALGETRRIRTVMVQATLWGMDTKKSAVRHRYYGPSTTGASLGQQ
ncbi:MAG: hypothetical protein K2R93_17065, partial [Gemmatimonadaceae bacterium]|nr:hypothetical protein [Gemmatimonadaceae bacterium]